MSETLTTENSYAFGEPAVAATIKSLAPDTVVRIDPKYVSVETDFNARDFTSVENKDHVTALSKNIASNGVQNALRVRVVGDRIVLVDGESRLRATLLAQKAASTAEEKAALSTVPVLIDPEANDPTNRTLSLVIKNMNRPLSPLETYNVVRRLQALGM